MNSFQKTVAVTCVAATLLAGGSLSAAAAPTSPAEASTEASTRDLQDNFQNVQKLVFQGNGGYVYVTDGGEFKSTSSRETAIANAGTWSVPRPGSTRGVFTNISDQGRHLSTRGSSAGTVWIEASKGADDNWSVYSDGSLSRLEDSSTAVRWYADVLSSNGLIQMSTTSGRLKLLSLPTIPITPPVTPPPVEPAPVTPPTASVPDAKPGQIVQATFAFPEYVNGKLVFTAPAHTKILAVNHSTCDIAGDGSTATCGTEDDRWKPDRIVTLQVDADVRDDRSIPWASQLPGGSLKVVKSGSTDITSTLTA